MTWRNQERSIISSGSRSRIGSGSHGALEVSSAEEEDEVRLDDLDQILEGGEGEGGGEGEEGKGRIGGKGSGRGGGEGGGRGEMKVDNLRLCSRASDNPAFI